MLKFVLDRNYLTLLESVGFSSREVLKKAEISENVFNQKFPSMTKDEYFRFMTAIETLSPNDDTPIKLASAEHIESFSPPLFAAYCSKNGLTCVERIARYKRLICPLILLIEQTKDEVSIEIGLEGSTEELPYVLVMTEMVFLINLIRKATKETVIPKEITARHLATNIEYERYFQTKVHKATKNKLVFDLDDMLKPFISQNDIMWDYFEPELKRRLNELEVDDSFSAKIRSALTELLPSGKSGINDVALKLGYNTRTLQRKLKTENTTFQKQLNHTRELLAKHYLKNSDMTSNDIAYLLGYQDLNSFFRSFVAWTGTNVSDYRKSL